MKKLFLSALVAVPFALANVSCGDAANILAGGNVLGNTGTEIALAKKATIDNCCNITITEFSLAAGTGKTKGCGKISEYKLENSIWVRQSLVDATAGANAGTAADRLAICPT